MFRAVMKILNTLAVLMAPALACASASHPPDADRQAILAMAGSYEIRFHFRETASIQPGYTAKPGSDDTTATEIIKVVDETPGRITLQHLLVVDGDGSEPQVIKHWAQIWTWQDTHILDYQGEHNDHEWAAVTLTPEQAAGTWSQLVTQTDDTPRYESHGKWTHHGGESSWQSAETRRPMPRRDYTKRDDYDYLAVINRHTLTSDGWIHFQDNRKVVDRDGEPPRILVHEIGINTYTRKPTDFTASAEAWWREHGEVWNGIRGFWISATDSATQQFRYATHHDGKSLRKQLAQIETEKPGASEIASRLSPYLITR